MSLLVLGAFASLDYIASLIAVAVCVGLRYGRSLEWRASGSVKVVPLAKPKEAPGEEAGAGDPP